MAWRAGSPMGKSLLVSFAIDEDDAERVFVVTDSDSSDFGGSESGGVHHFEHGFVALPESAVFR